MTGCWQWKRGSRTGHTRSYHITRNERVISTIDITCDVPDHAWHLGNIVDVFRQIERSNQPPTLHAVAAGCDTETKQGCSPTDPQARSSTMTTGTGSSFQTDPAPDRTPVRKDARRVGQ